MVRLNCSIIAILLLILNGQSEAHKNYHKGATVLERLEEIELTNDCGKCAFDKQFYRKCGISIGTPSTCKNGPGGNHCDLRRRRNIRALTESESNYSKNEENSSGVAQIDFLHESESSSRGLQGYFSDRWEEMILDRENCLDVVYLNEKNNVDGGLTRPVTTIEFPNNISNKIARTGATFAQTPQ